MAIKFPCPQCSQMIELPDRDAGKRATCPACGELVMVPTESDTDIYDLAPVDDDAERRAEKERNDALRMTQQLLHERAVPGESAQDRSSSGSSGSPRPTARTGGGGGGVEAEVESRLKFYIKAMGEGRLDDAERAVTALKPHAAVVDTWMDRLARDEMLLAEFSTLPAPVVIGFVRKLRQQL